MMAAKAIKIDFSDTESRGGKKGRGGRKHYPPGDYAVKCIRAEATKSSEKETPGILLVFKFTQGKLKGQEVNDILWLTPKSLWRVRQTIEAMGMKVPSKAVNIDLDKLKNRELAITLDDEEYDDKVYSRVVDAFLVSELDDEDEDEDEDEESESEDEDEDDDKKSTDDDDLEDLEDL
jgi:hypothetical protein